MRARGVSTDTFFLLWTETPRALLHVMVIPPPFTPDDPLPLMSHEPAYKKPPPSSTISPFLQYFFASRPSVRKLAIPPLPSEEPRYSGKPRTPLTSSLLREDFPSPCAPPGHNLASFCAPERRGQLRLDLTEHRAELRRTIATPSDHLTPAHLATSIASTS
jgi:hypothetical protein